MLCPAEKYLEFAADLRDKHGFDMLVDLTAIDWEHDLPRFMVVVHFLSTTKHSYLRVSVKCEDDNSPEIPSLATLYPAADWHERECYDMFE